MDHKILLIDAKTALGGCLSQSLSLAGYQVITGSNLVVAQKNLNQIEPDLVLINGLGQPETWLNKAEGLSWPSPLILIVAEPSPPAEAVRTRLAVPFAFQDLLSLVREALVWV